jgi:predicted AAA+ superfamily ATPase
LTGRNRKFYLYPLSIKEIVESYGKIKIAKELENYLTFGMYPKIVSVESREEKAILIKELAMDYLFKDLKFTMIKYLRILFLLINLTSNIISLETNVLLRWTQPQMYP